MALIGLASILFLIVFLELGERKSSFVKSWLYESNITNELLVATVAMTPDKDPDITREKIAEFILDIKTTHPRIDLIVFGEVILGWYRAETSEYHERISEYIPGDTTTLIATLAKDNNVSVSFGMAEKSGSEIFNSQVLINNSGEITNVHRKKKLKSSFFSSGLEPIAFVDIKGVKAVVVICYDMRWAETIKKAKDSNADMIILSNADYIDDWDDTHFGYRYLAKQYGTWIVTANRYGKEYETNWDGHIEIMNPFGDLENSGRQKEQYLIQTLRINAEQSRGMKFVRRVYSKLSVGYLIIKHPRIALSYL